MPAELMPDRHDQTTRANGQPSPRLILIRGAGHDHRYYRGLFDGGAGHRPRTMRAMELGPLAGGGSDAADTGSAMRYAWDYLVESFGQSSVWFFASELSFAEMPPRRELHLSRLVELAGAGIVRQWRRLRRELDIRQTIAVLRELDRATLRDIGVDSRELIAPAVRARHPPG
ncbi:hypothetical protein LGR54_13990 [Ancylobacter sp. Lp-2]|uniref:hypothetical protein n=1 Tax=Ancylobacter sp. Lp-2 TaxID=2881339 RepID=UPI001E2ADF7B|nr:hypothetical protein [Ancylobacter sp. Lp-2]MCB4769724.1 hypothetical protein [Ancylobacter sp. Lp-2]